MTTANDQALDLIWRNARSHNGWQDKPVDDALLHHGMHEMAEQRLLDAEYAGVKLRVLGFLAQIESAALLLEMPFGAWLLTGVGLMIIGIGVATVLW